MLFFPLMTLWILQILFFFSLHFVWISSDQWSTFGEIKTVTYEAVQTWTSYVTYQTTADIRAFRETTNLGTNTTTVSPKSPHDETGPKLQWTQHWASLDYEHLWWERRRATGSIDGLFDCDNALVLLSTLKRSWPSQICLSTTTHLACDVSSLQSTHHYTGRTLVTLSLSIRLQ